MLLFSRVVTPSGSPRKVMPWVADITEYVNANSTLQVTCWTGTFGYPLGTVAWSCFLDSQATLVAATNALMGQSAYLDRLDAAAELVTTPGQDLLREVIYGSPSDPPPLGAVANITTATAMVDRLADAMGWAVELAQYLEGVTGTRIGVLTDVFGTIGGITWIGVAPDVAASEAARAKAAADPGYISRLTATKELFLAGSGHTGQVTRIA